MMVGLANPIMKYDKTRHNIGSRYIQTLAKRYHQSFKEEKKFFGYTSLVLIKKKIIRLLIPDTYMNISGKSVFSMAAFYHITLNDILVVHDELDLFPGIIKYKNSIGHNGHNGLRNIINLFNEKKSFPRIAIGIGRPIKKKEVAYFVLSPPTRKENILINKAIEESINIIVQLIDSS
ncbi:aminoacyl-tRNA hydrolase [Buchnera aphidicola]|uniref:aminoacyl-tRNA hydrolase n=1 Tax=Buchnera aphidicola TaxID=9 RepID=UPI003464D1AB